MPRTPEEIADTICVPYTLKGITPSQIRDLLVQAAREAQFSVTFAGVSDDIQSAARYAAAIKLLKEYDSQQNPPHSLSGYNMQAYKLASALRSLLKVSTTEQVQETAAFKPDDRPDIYRDLWNENMPRVSGCMYFAIPGEQPIHVADDQARRILEMLSSES